MTCDKKFTNTPKDYVRGRMQWTKQKEFENHLKQCKACQEIVDHEKELMDNDKFQESLGLESSIDLTDPSMEA